jgi:hypothetical protein
LLRMPAILRSLDPHQEKVIWNSPQRIDRHCGDPSMRRLMWPLPKSPHHESAVPIP